MAFEISNNKNKRVSIGYSYSIPLDQRTDKDVSERIKFISYYNGEDLEKEIYPATSFKVSDLTNMTLELAELKKEDVWYPELWEPIEIESDITIAQEMFNDPNFIYNTLPIWKGLENEFDLENDYYRIDTCLSWLISCEYNWLVNREQSKEKPDEEKIERFQREAPWHCESLMSPILLKYYSYEAVKQKAYEFYKAMQQQKQAGHVLNKKLTQPKNTGNK